MFELQRSASHSRPGQRIEDRRTHSRVPLRLRACLNRPSAARSIRTITENVSIGGFYCICDERVPVGEEMECIIEIPDEIPKTGNSLFVRCKVRVLRVSEHDVYRFGVACAIESYHVVPPALSVV